VNGKPPIVPRTGTPKLVIPLGKLVRDMVSLL